MYSLSSSDCPESVLSTCEDVLMSYISGNTLETQRFNITPIITAGMAEELLHLLPPLRPFMSVPPGMHQQLNAISLYVLFPFIIVTF